MDYIHSIDELKPFLKDNDYIDIKTVTGNVSLREFIAGMMSYNPGWIRFLYKIRAGFVRILGMKQPELIIPIYKAEDVPFETGEMLSFFTVASASEESYWAGGIKDTHLDAFLIIVSEPITGRPGKYHVITVVRYNHWTGSVYFNVIRPFHHLVVSAMAKSAVILKTR